MDKVLLKLYKNKDFKKLDEEMLNCKKCQGLNIPKSTMNAGAGWGSLNAELFVVGQSLHSYNSNTEGRQIPFKAFNESLDSGIILYKALEDAGYSFKKENLFITNVISCHPPNNRKSRPEEIRNCFEYLQRTLEIIYPRILLTVGTDAREWFKLPRQRNGEFASYFNQTRINGSDYKIIVSVHPSYVKRWGTVKDEQTYINQLVAALKQAE